MSKSGLNTTMQSTGSGTPAPSVKGAKTKGYCPPFDMPHSTGPATIPVVFEQDMPHSTPATLNSAMNGPQNVSGKRESELGRK